MIKVYIENLDIKMFEGVKREVLYRTACPGADLKGVPGPDRCGVSAG